MTKHPKCTIYKYNPEDSSESVDSSKLLPITTREELQEGDKIWILSEVGHHLMTVKKVGPSDELGAYYGTLGAVLQFVIDDYHCWVCESLYNLRDADDCVKHLD